MPVGKEDLTWNDAVFQYQSFGYLNTGKKRHYRICTVAKERVAFCFRIFRVLFDDIVIAVYHVKSAGTVELGHKPKCIAMGTYYPVDTAVFP